MMSEANKSEANHNNEVVMPEMSEHKSMFKPGSLEDMAQAVAKELNKQRPEQSPQETDEEVLQFILSEKERGVPEDDIRISLAELLTSNRQEQRIILQKFMATKREKKPLPGAGQEFGLIDRD